MLRVPRRFVIFTPLRALWTPKEKLVKLFEKLRTKVMIWEAQPFVFPLNKEHDVRADVMYGCLVALLHSAVYKQSHVSSQRAHALCFTALWASDENVMF